MFRSAVARQAVKLQVARKPTSYKVSRWLSTASEDKIKVLVANRGEIVQRVMRTCHMYPEKFSTVAIYSSADANAPFVKEAQESVWVGPAIASQSYLNQENVLNAITSTGTGAVHPGYGFLSENAKFAEAVTDAGAIWLGPPTNAVKDMGDKLRSKEVALQAGVSIVPGFDGVIESPEHACEVANDIGYPILLKAANGGGGKGMRICYSDAELKEAFPMAKAEAINYFSDDRLLVEKYIINPHHIEFQVLCCKDKETGEVEVVVFPERECSIQRRNQKVVEESPSCLLSQETRLKMAEQVRLLCQTVGYESAGTVEFLVDEEQNFYFLEMNTRLQVEHPISEAVCGVDLVKGMLWVGAGWGLPEEFKTTEAILPFKGHAIEARIYAEDPLRGFLPSTGTLRPYREPTIFTAENGAYTRVDSGVAPGHIVNSFYDPMLSKIVHWAPSRTEAVLGLAQAMDEYVIEGLQHNARLVNAVLRHPEFIEGNTPTSFLDTHYPEGFKGVTLTQSQKEELAVAMFNLKGSPSTDAHAIVKVGGMFGDSFKVTAKEDGSYLVQFIAVEEGETDGDERTISLSSQIEYDTLDCLAQVSLDGVPRTIQIVNEEHTGEINAQMYGASLQVLLQSPREFELSKHMHKPIPHDTSNIVASPMPGVLVSLAVEEGQVVEDGQELCIVEAMKMQNIIRSPRAGVISKLRVGAGATLKADEVIIEFVPEAAEEAAA